MNNIPLTIIFLLAMGCSIAEAEQVNLAGKVTDQNGTALISATVTLARANLSATTDASGNYQITGVHVVQLKAIAGAVPVPSLSHSQVLFSVKESSTPVNIDLFDLQGRLLHSPLNSRLAPGSYSISINEKADNGHMGIIRLQIGKDRYVFRVFPDFMLPSITSSLEAQSGSYSLYKSEALPVDTLVASLSGYLPARIPIQAFTGTVNLMLQKGFRISFTINNGAASVIIPACSLSLVDSSLMLAHARFTQKVEHYLEKADSAVRTVANLDDPEDLPDPTTIASLLAMRYLTTAGALGTGVRKGVEPNFDSLDARNPQRDLACGIQQRYSFPWLLEMGNGIKTVYAELTFKDSIKDTVSYSVPIKPWTVSLKLQNSTSGIAPDMWDTNMTEYWNKWNWDEYYLHKPWPQFALSINADSTFAVDFDYWLITPYSHYFFVSGQNDSTAGWLETAPRAAQFTNGGGASHNDAYIYTYSLDTNSSEGQENLTDLKYCLKHVKDVTEKEINYDIRLTGTEAFNEYATPGSYWGASPKRWNGTTGQLQVVQRTISGTPAQNFRQFIDLTFGGKTNVGFKEFLIAVRMKGKFFNDTRMYLSRSYMFTSNPPVGSNHKKCYFDFYPAKATQVSPDFPGYLTNGDTIYGNFSFMLNPDGSIIDKGRARIREINLVIAEYPAGLVWNCSDWCYVGGFPPVTLADLKNQRNMIIPFPISEPARTINFVRWDSINVSGWPSGKYFIGVITKDVYGMEALASMGTDRSCSTNPFLVTILTGR